MRRVLKGLKGRKSFAESKFKEVVKLAISCIANLKEERYKMCSANLKSIQVFIPYQPPVLNPALRRCGDLIKKQNRLDAYIIIEGYLNLLIQRIDLFGNGRECPVELEEAASGVIFAATRCKEIPELEQIKSILASHFDREFIGRAVELRNNNALHILELQEKLSELRPTPESKMNLLRSIASQKSQPPPPPPIQEKMSGEQISKRQWSKRSISQMIETSSSVFGSEDSSNSSGSRKRKNKGVALNTSSNEFTIELPSTSIQTTPKNKGLKTSPIETSLDSFASTQTNVKPSSLNKTTQKNKGVHFNNTSPKPTGVKIPLSSKQTIQKNKAVPLNTNPTPTYFDQEKRRYPTRSSSSSDKS